MSSAHPMPAFLPVDGVRPIVIAIGTTNGAKRRAVEMAFKQVFPDHAIEIHPFDVPSDIRPQPLTANETLTGAINRAKACRARFIETQIDPLVPDFAIGLEGGIEQVIDTYFESGFIYIIGRDGRVGVGTSARYEISSAMMAHLADGAELGDVIDRLADNQSVLPIRAVQGMMGIITNGLLPRDLAYSHGVIFALARWVSNEHYWDDKKIE